MNNWLKDDKLLAKSIEDYIVVNNNITEDIEFLNDIIKNQKEKNILDKIDFERLYYIELLYLDNSEIQTLIKDIKKAISSQYIFKLRLNVKYNHTNQFKDKIGDYFFPNGITLNESREGNRLLNKLEEATTNGTINQ